MSEEPGDADLIAVLASVEQSYAQYQEKFRNGNG
jgi:hypothetical protein